MSIRETHESDSISIITDELASVEGRQKDIAGSRFVCCPFHAEKTPSCSVNLSYDNDVPIGFFHCFGCGEKGDWNKFADVLNLRHIKEWQSKIGSTEYAKNRETKNRINLLGKNNQSIQRLFDEVGNEVIPWPKSMEWRSYKGKFLSRIGMYCFNDPRTDELQMLFPVYIRGRYKGGVRATMEKVSWKSSYLTTKGGWVKDYGLLGFDLIEEKNLFGCNSVVLVEGPRDWLRLTKEKIPCLGILGSKSVSKKKMLLIQSLGVKCIYSLPDNDVSGEGMAVLVKKYADELGIKSEYLRLPRKKDASGKIIPMDPDNAPPKVISKIKRIVYA